MRYLNVPFSEKDQAKALGARWDNIARRWYIPQSLLDHSDQFAKWFLQEDESILDSTNSTKDKQEIGSIQSHLKATAQNQANFTRPVAIDRVSSKTNSSNVESSLSSREQSALSLSQILNSVKRALQNQLSQAQWLIAEVANIQQRNGHYYLELTETDQNGVQIAKTRSMIWARTAKNILPEFENNTGKSLEIGQKVLLLVNVNFHEKYGFSLQIEDIDASYSLGEMERALVELRETLRREKRLEINKSFSLPEDFFKVAVIAPPNAAGLGDFKVDAKRLQALEICEFDYFSAAFQGEKVAIEITTALQKIQQQTTSQYDAVVIIRGGGAKLDLQYLNQYSIAKALSELKIPVITGIGHERDNCILDEMAALRCDTPSKVIGYIFSQISQQAAKANSHWQFIHQQTQTKLHHARQILQQFNHQLEQGALQRWHQAVAKLQPSYVSIQQSAQQIIKQQQVSVEQFYQNIDRQAWHTWQQTKSHIVSIAQVTDKKIQNIFKEKQQDIEKFQKIIEQLSWQIWRDKQSLVHPIYDQIQNNGQKVIQQNRQDINRLEHSIETRVDYLIQNQARECQYLHQQVLTQATKAITEQRQSAKHAIRVILNSSLEPQLERGFVIAKDAQGKAITSKAKAIQKAEFSLVFYDGEMKVKPKSSVINKSQLKESQNE